MPRRTSLATGAARVCEEAEDPSLKAQYGGFVSVWDDEADSPSHARQSLRVALGVRASTDCALSGMSPTGGSSAGIGELSTSSAEDIEDHVRESGDFIVHSPQLIEGIQVPTLTHRTPAAKGMSVLTYETPMPTRTSPDGFMESR